MRRLEDNEAIDCLIVSEGMKNRQLYNGWLLGRAADKLGYDVVKLKRLEDKTNRISPDELIEASTMGMTPEERWILSEKLRKSKPQRLSSFCDALCSRVGIERPENMLISTVTREEMFDNPLDDVKYATKRWIGWKDHVSHSFTGYIDVITDMEEVPNEADAVKTANWLGSTGAADLFNIIDTRTATLRWTGGGWSISPYDLNEFTMIDGLYQVGDEQDAI